MCKETLVLAVLSTFLLVTPTLAQQWQTFYLDPSDYHFIKIEDPAKRLILSEDRWISDCVDESWNRWEPYWNITGVQPRPKLYFKIPEFNDVGGYIKFHYARPNGHNYFYLYASKDGSEYVVLWSDEDVYPKDEIVTVEVPPGYKYFYFYFKDEGIAGSNITLWKEIQFNVSGIPTRIPTPSSVWQRTTPTQTTPPAHVPSLPPSTPQLQPRLGIESSDLLTACIAVAVAALIATKSKKTKSKKV